MYNYEINSFAKQLCSDIRYVRSNNMLGNMDTYVRMNESNGCEGYILIENGKSVKSIYMTQNIEVIDTVKDKKNERIYFKNDGSPSANGGTITIYNDKVSKEITVVPISGRVLFKDVQYEK